MTLCRMKTSKLEAIGSDTSPTCYFSLHNQSKTQWEDKHKNPVPSQLLRTCIFSSTTIFSLLWKFFASVHVADLVDGDGKLCCLQFHFTLIFQTILVVALITRMEMLSLYNDQCWAGRSVDCAAWKKNFNVAIFLDTINVINVKLSM